MKMVLTDIFKKISLKNISEKNERKIYLAFGCSNTITKERVVYSACLLQSLFKYFLFVSLWLVWSCSAPDVCYFYRIRCAFLTRHLRFSVRICTFLTSHCRFLLIDSFALWAYYLSGGTYLLAMEDIYETIFFRFYMYNLYSLRSGNYRIFATMLVLGEYNKSDTNKFLWTIKTLFSKLTGTLHKLIQLCLSEAF